MTFAGGLRIVATPPHSFENRCKTLKIKAQMPVVKKEPHPMMPMTTVKCEATKRGIREKS
jgi:hypothetical protein